MLEINTNIFNGIYYKEQLSKYQNLEDKKIGNVELRYVDISMDRVDGYMYKNLLTQSRVPVLKINGQTWMSLTPMEVESHYLPIKRAKGVVGVGGLGFGYYVQEIAKKEEVERIDVYEIDDEVIEMYIANFGNNPKINIIKEDVLTIKDKEYDFFYCDIYLGQMDLDALKDKALITKNNKIGEYFYWTMEAVLQACLQVYDTDLFDELIEGYSTSFRSDLMDFSNSLYTVKNGMLLNLGYVLSDLPDILDDIDDMEGVS